MFLQMIVMNMNDECDAALQQFLMQWRIQNFIMGADGRGEGSGSEKN